MATLSIEELTSCIMSFMILAGGLDRSTTVLTANYNDFTDGSRSQFQDLDSRLVKGFKVRERKGKHKVRHEIKKPNDKVNLKKNYKKKII